MTPETVRVAFRRLAVGGLDPTTRTDDDGLWRASLTVDGPATVWIGWSDPSEDSRAWGPGADVLRASVDSLTGRRDDPAPIPAVHDAVRTACRRHWRTPLVRSDDPYHELLPAILGQRVTAREASAQWRRLCSDFGGRAPGPNADLLLPPDPRRLASLAYHDLHRYGIERKRAGALIDTARRATSLVLGASSSRVSDQSLLLRIPGIGPWTAALVASAAFGDPDAVPVGDFHLKNTVALALGGKDRGTDDEMMELLEPYRGQRGRVLWWLRLEGWRAPRRGPSRRNLSVADL